MKLFEESSEGAAKRAKELLDTAAENTKYGATVAAKHIAAGAQQASRTAHQLHSRYFSCRSRPKQSLASQQVGASMYGSTTDINAVIAALELKISAANSYLLSKERPAHFTDPRRDLVTMNILDSCIYTLRNTACASDHLDVLNRILFGKDPDAYDALVKTIISPESQAAGIYTVLPFSIFSQSPKTALSLVREIVTVANQLAEQERKMSPPVPRST